MGGTTNAIIIEINILTILLIVCVISSTLLIDLRYLIKKVKVKLMNLNELIRQCNSLHTLVLCTTKSTTRQSEQVKYSTINYINGN